MRARDPAQPYVSVSTDIDAVEAVSLVVGRAEPFAILPACDVVGMLIPGHIQENPELAAVIDEPHADRLFRAMAGRPLADRLPTEGPSFPLPLRIARPWSRPD